MTETQGTRLAWRRAGGRARAGRLGAVLAADLGAGTAGPEVDLVPTQAARRGAAVAALADVGQRRAARVVHGGRARGA